MAIENEADVRGLIRRTFDAPGEAVAELPELLRALEHPDRVVRIGAAWALCSVAATRPEVAGQVRGELLNRSGTAAELAAAWIGREVTDDGSDDSSASGTSEPGPTDGADATSAAGTDEASSDDDPELPVGAGRPGSADEDATDTDSNDVSASSNDQRRTTSNDQRRETSAAGRSPDGRDEVVDGDRFTVELDRTRLDALEIVDHVATDRVSWTYVGMAEIDAERSAVLVRTFRPPHGAHPATFWNAFEPVLSGWAGIDDHEHVLTVHDYGRRPHPWTILDYAPRTLRTVGQLPTVAALRMGLDVATALAHAHERGVTHRCLDPRSVAIDEAAGRPIGKLFNFGIVDPFRAVDGPLPMDSRYAAPELFDDRLGAIDYMTDLYHLGATLYTAFTGRPPYTSSLVAEGGPANRSYEPPSSVVEDLPVAADRIVSKAMATHKIARYESADEFARDLQTALEEIEETA